MAITLNFFDTYVLLAAIEEIKPEYLFFRDRYFPTEDDNIFAADKVLVEYRKGDKQIAPFVADRIGDIPVAREGYKVHEFAPARISLSRGLSLDDLDKRGFGEALYANSTRAERALRLQVDDLTTLDRRIARREEWMAVQTMMNNACTMQEYVDAKKLGDTKYVQFYEADGENDHKYTVSATWDTDGSDFVGDVAVMCDLLVKRGQRAEDLLLGPDAADAVLNNEKFRELLDRNLAYRFGEVNHEILYPGVTKMGTFNFKGHLLTIFVVNETYDDGVNEDVRYFPANAAMVTAPKCGHISYAQITQIDYGTTDYQTYSGKRIPKLSVNQDADTKKIRLACRPLAMPNNYCPYIFAENVVTE